MKILLINKFLYQNGGSETYIFKLGDALKSLGHEVEYFGMEHDNRIVGNRVNSYTSNMDFHEGSKISKIIYPLKTIYSKEARKKIRLVLDDFKPDICHLNNFNFQLTPSIILEIDSWRKKNNKNCKIIYTAHDYQLVCPNHMCRQPMADTNCERCLSGKFFSCFKGKCIHSSYLKSFVGMCEAYFWKLNGAYKKIDKIICPSHFMKSKLDNNPVLAEKTVVLHNFIDLQESPEYSKKDYVLYFGRYSKEKGIKTLIEVCKRLPDINFVFAGSGPLESDLSEVSNIKNVGFKSGAELIKLISEAKFSVYPSEWYENCPFSVMESQAYKTPVLSADIGGIPELINIGHTGELFKSGNAEDLKAKIESLWNDDKRIRFMTENCNTPMFYSVNDYIGEFFNKG